MHFIAPLYAGFAVAAAASLQTSRFVTRNDNQNYGLTWKDCGNQHDALIVNSISVRPCKSGNRGYEMVIDTTVNDHIENGAYAHIKIKKDGQQVFDQDVDLCNDLWAGTTLKCPVAPGNHEIVKPLGQGEQEQSPEKFELKFKAKDSRGHQIGCVEIKTDNNN